LKIKIHVDINVEEGYSQEAGKRTVCEWVCQELVHLWVLHVTCKSTVSVRMWIFMGLIGGDRMKREARPRV